MDINNIKYDERGLVPTITIDYKSKLPLMLAYMNKESLQMTIDTKKVTYFSRSRNELWIKGETSGNYQELKNIYTDCDSDTILVEANQLGNACHTGSMSCFYEDAEFEDKSVDILGKLDGIIKDRKANPVKDSYTNYLFEKGLDKILKKVGEENAEVIIAAKNRDKKEIVYEVADLTYHMLVLLNELDVDIEDVKTELKKRFK